ncbi:MAG: hypothetical protein EOO39_05745 [Cytophagaceae bacterium]|nr:MAG: hypothetical protein EOO39_05745 [Cytophagaceae bacterium]
MAAQVRQRQVNVSSTNNGRGFNSQLTNNIIARQKMQQRGGAIGREQLIDSLLVRGTNANLIDLLH